MKKLIIFFLAFPVFAAELISYNIYDRNDRVDLMLSFDSAYNGKISQKKDGNLTLLSMSELKFNKNEIKNLNSNLIDKISINSKNNTTYIMLQNKSEIKLEISSVNNKFGVRIRALSPNALKEQTQSPVNEPIKTKNDAMTYDYTNYILLMLVLVTLLAVLWFVKRNLLCKGLNSKDFKIIFQKPLDKNNKFIIFINENKRYTMIIGNSNLVLECIENPNEKPKISKDEKSFDTFFEENKKRIQNLVEQRKKT